MQTRLVLSGLVSVHLDNLLHLLEAQLDVPNGAVVEFGEVVAVCIGLLLVHVIPLSLLLLLGGAHGVELSNDFVLLHVDLGSGAEVIGPIDEHLVGADVSFSLSSSLNEKGGLGSHYLRSGAHNGKCA